MLSHTVLLVGIHLFYSLSGGFIEFHLEDLIVLLLLIVYVLFIYGSS